MASSVRDVNISVGSDDILTTDNVEIQRVLSYAKDANGNLHPLDSDQNGHLKVKIQDTQVKRSVVDITNDFSGTALGGSLPDGTATEYWDSEDFNKFQLAISNTNGDFGTLRLQTSSTTTSGDFMDIAGVFEESVSLGMTTIYFFRHTLDSACGRYYRILNSTGATITFDDIRIFFVK